MMKNAHRRRRHLCAAHALFPRFFLLPHCRALLHSLHSALSLSFARTRAAPLLRTAAHSFAARCCAHTAPPLCFLCSRASIYKKAGRIVRLWHVKFLKWDIASNIRIGSGSGSIFHILRAFLSFSFFRLVYVWFTFSHFLSFTTFSLFFTFSLLTFCTV